MMRILKILLLLLTFSTLTSCDVKENNEAKQNSFSKIYHDGDYSSDFYPITIKETSDLGFLILGVRNSQDIYILKTDEHGDVQWTINGFVGSLSPIGEMFEVNNEYYFFAMAENTFEIQLLHILENAQSIELINQWTEETYALAAFAGFDNLPVIQHYNRDGARINIRKINISGEEQMEALEVNPGNSAEIEKEIIENAEVAEPQYPYFIGEIEGTGYFINTFRAYHFRTIFMDYQGNKLGGEIRETNGDEAALKALLHLENDRFALARYDKEGKFYFNANYSIDVNSTIYASEIPGENLPQVAQNGAVIIKKIEIDDEEYILFASDTKNGQIEIFVYNFSNGEFINSYHVGHNNYYHISDYIITDDGGLAILAQTATAGKFNQISIIKLDDKTLKDLVLNE